MKTSISAILFVSALSPTSSTSATTHRDKRTCALPSHTTANGQDYVFDREYVLGSSSPGTTCNDGTYSSINKKIKSASECGVACVYKGDMSSTLLLHGYDYNCDDQKCDCIYGTKWEDINTKVKPSKKNMACYGLESDGPAPTPTDQCVDNLPNEARIAGKDDEDYLFKREYLDGSSSPGTTCNDGTSESFENVQNTDACAIKCAYKGDMSSSLLLKGFDYNCDDQECDCIYETKWEDINTKVKPSKKNMACYGLAKVSPSESGGKKYLRVN